MGGEEFLKICLGKLSQIKRYKEETDKFVNETFIEFLPNNGSSDTFLEECEHLLDEGNKTISGLENNDDAENRTVEVEHFKNDLKDAISLLKINYRILKIDNLFQCIEEAKASGEYVLALDLLSKLSGLIYFEESNDKRLFQKTPAFENIKVKYHIESYILMENLKKKFDDLVHFEEKQLPNSHNVEMIISKNEIELQDTVLALFQTNFNPKKFCDLLMKKFFEPAIKRNISIDLNESEDNIVLKLHCHPLKESNFHSKNLYTNVLNNIRTILTVLNKMNVSIAENKHFLTIIGDHIGEKFFSLLINDCLMLAIPENANEMKTSNLIVDIAHFEQFLADIFFIDIEKDKYLSEFCEKYETYSKNATLKFLMDNTKRIMQKDMLDMTITDERNTIDVVLNNPMLFPKCMISRSVLEFVKFLESILLQQIDSDNLEEEKEYFSKQVIVLLNAYIIAIPKIHSESLENIPQQAALFYNNCIFLSHWVVKNFERTKLSFSIILNSLQSTGKKFLEMEIDSQHQILLKILEEFLAVDETVTPTRPLKVIKKCFRKMVLLQNVWRNILPDDIYNKTFKEILCKFYNVIIQRILSIKKISVTFTKELIKVLDFTVLNSKYLFKDSKQVLEIKNWHRIEKLKTILNASLQEVTELWCSDQLNGTFTAEEIRLVTRIMFPNTEIRAKALSKLI